MTLKKFATQIRPDQHQALERIATRAVKMQDHVQRALDIYFSLPANQAALVELPEEPEALPEQKRGA